jgi:hypothetical protein
MPVFVRMPFPEQRAQQINVQHVTRISLSAAEREMETEE